MFDDIPALRSRRQAAAGRAAAVLTAARADGREKLTTAETNAYRSAMAEAQHASDEIERRDQIAGSLSRFGAGRAGVENRRDAGTRVTAGLLSPLGWPDEELRRLQTAAQRGEPCRVEVRDFSTADPLLPSGLFPYPVAAQHEGRLLDRLPGYSIETPAVTFIRHVSTTGAPAAVGEGQEKPEVIFETDALTANAVKLAAHNGLSYEIVNDWPSFQAYAGGELYRQIIDVENLELLQGNSHLVGSGVDASPTGMTGFLATPGILEHDASTDTGTDVQGLDSIEIAFSELRTGPALAVPDLLVLHPETWSALRRTKDGYGRYLTSADPTAEQATQLWGVEVLQTTQIPRGIGLAMDLGKFGYVAVRESLSMRIGYANDDLTRNIIRTVAEERLVLCVTRPPAVISITNLPTA